MLESEAFLLHLKLLEPHLIAPSSHDTTLGALRGQRRRRSHRRALTQPLLVHSCKENNKPSGTHAVFENAHNVNHVIAVAIHLNILCNISLKICYFLLIASCPAYSQTMAEREFFPFWVDLFPVTGRIAAQFVTCCVHQTWRVTDHCTGPAPVLCDRGDQSQ